MSTTLKSFAAAVLDPARPVPDGVQSPRATADNKRFAVYRNNVFVSLVGVLEKRFPVTRRLVGEEFFTGMARAFAGIERPASPMMMRYGDSFPGFIRDFPPAASVGYLGDVAELEARWSDAYHAADATPLAVAALAGIAPEAVATTRLVAHPASRLLRSDYPIGSIWAAHQSAEVAPLTNRTAETVLIVRPAADVRVHILPPTDAGFANALLAGASIGEAATHGAQGFDLGTALVGLVTLGAFTGLVTEGETADVDAD